MPTFYSSVQSASSSTCATPRFVATAPMNNEVGNKLPNEVAPTVLIEEGRCPYPIILTVATLCFLALTYYSIFFLKMQLLFLFFVNLLQVYSCKVPCGIFTLTDAKPITIGINHMVIQANAHRAQHLSDIMCQSQIIIGRIGQTVRVIVC